VPATPAANACAIAVAVRLALPFSAATSIAEATAWMLPLAMAWAIAWMVEGRERVVFLELDGAAAVLLLAWAACRTARCGGYVSSHTWSILSSS
jgi:hypothetical protein